jgi:hypothetical protein
VLLSAYYHKIWKNYNRQDHLNIYQVLTSRNTWLSDKFTNATKNHIIVQLHHPTTEHKKESMYTHKKKKKTLFGTNARYIMTLCSLIGESVIK